MTISKQFSLATNSTTYVSSNGSDLQASGFLSDPKQYPQQQAQMPSENTVRQHQAHNIQEPLHLSSTSLQSEWVSTNNATIGVTRHRDAIVIQDDTSDTESTESFHTAPSSPMHIAPNNDRDNSEQTTSMDELLREEEKWKRALEYKSRQIEAIAWAMGAKRAELKELKLKEMEYRTRKQFLRNH